MTTIKYKIVDQNGCVGQIEKMEEGYDGSSIVWKEPSSTQTCYCPIEDLEDSVI